MFYKHILFILFLKLLFFFFFIFYFSFAEQNVLQTETMNQVAVKGKFSSKGEHIVDALIVRRSVRQSVRLSFRFSC
jgi:hypothetical protein